MSNIEWTMQDSAVILSLSQQNKTQEHKKFTIEEDRIINLLSEIVVQNTIKQSYEKEMPCIPALQ